MSRIDTGKIVQYDFSVKFSHTPLGDVMDDMSGESPVYCTTAAADLKAMLLPNTKRPRFFIVVPTVNGDMIVPLHFNNFKDRSGKKHEEWHALSPQVEVDDCPYEECARPFCKFIHAESGPSTKAVVRAFTSMKINTITHFLMYTTGNSDVLAQMAKNTPGVMKHFERLAQPAAAQPAAVQPSSPVAAPPGLPVGSDWARLPGSVKPPKSAARPQVQVPPATLMRTIRAAQEECIRRAQEAKERAAAAEREAKRAQEEADRFQEDLLKSVGNQVSHSAEQMVDPVFVGAVTELLSKITELLKAQENEACEDVLELIASFEADHLQ